MSEPTGFPPYQPPRDPVPTSAPARPPRPPRPAAPGQLLGIAQHAHVRSEGAGSGEYARSWTVLSFRLVHPETGQPIQVEMRGPLLSGAIHDGDWVEVAERPDTYGVIRALSANNLTTGSHVTVRAKTSPAAIVLMLVLLVPVLLIFLFVVLGLIVTLATP